MKTKSTLLFAMACASAAWAQTVVPPSQAVVQGARTALSEKTATPEKPAAAEKKPAAKASVGMQSATQKPQAAQKVAAQAVEARPKPAAQRSPRPAKPVARKSSQALTMKPAVPALPATAAEKKSGKRDPFVSPIVRAEAVTSSPCEGPGKKCLEPSQVVLRGVVRAPGGMIAVVESSARKISYFLRENDPVFNGYVVKITADSVVFRENTNDTLGRQGTRDIVKRVNAPAV